MSNNTLTTELYTSLFMQLARLEASGIPTTKALRLLKTKDNQVNQKIAKMQQLSSSGSSIASAGFIAKIFTQTHKALINAGERSGQLVHVYQQQADYYKNKSRRFKKMKSQLYIPAFFLLLALLIKPIHLLFSGAISLLGYLSMSVGVFLFIASLFFFTYKLSVWFKSPFDLLQLNLPIIKEWLIKRQVNEFLMILAFLLEGGLPASEALPLATESIKNSVLRKHFDLSCRAGDPGASIMDRLSPITVIPAAARQTIHAGEISGRLASGLLQYTQHQRELINIDDDALAKWVPRWFYAAVVLGVMI